MRRSIIACAVVTSASVLAVSGPAHAAANAGQLKPVEKKVDLERYMGTWKQIAVIPQIFQAQCVADTTATYSLRSDGSVNVVNTCTTGIGTKSTAKGFATVQNPDNNAELQVRFPFVEGISGPPKGTNYVITYLNDDYSLAIVGDFKRKQGYVLSRKAHLSNAEWKQVKKTVTNRGYDSCKFLISPTKGGKWFPAPLCWV